jgi:lipopolysaccharide assembly protein A
MKYLAWLLKAAIFFTLFAFALNNQQDVTVHFFFGTSWTAPLVLVVLAVFAAGLVIGAVGMVPRWWRHRKASRMASSPDTLAAPSTLIGQGTPPTHGL